MTYIPEFSVLVAYTIACAVLFITPGPDMSLFLAKTLAGGRQAGVAAYLGASTGSLVHTLMAALGISALLAASATAFLVLKVVGAGYLVWLAIDAIRSGSTLKLSGGREKATSFRRNFAVGVGVNLTNPKVVLFFITFLPQFVHSTDPNAAGKLLFLGIYSVLFWLPCGFATIFAAEKLVALLKARPVVTRAIDWLFASVFCLFALKILTTERT